MANYLDLKQQFNNNKTFIQQVLQSKKCQLRLKDEGVLILNNLINETTEKLNSNPKVDNPNYSYILTLRLPAFIALKLANSFLELHAPKVMDIVLINNKANIFLIYFPPNLFILLFNNFQKHSNVS